MTRVGLGLFLIGVALFLVAGVVDDYRLDLEALRQSEVLLAGHAEIVLDELASLDGRHYSSLRRFVADVDDRLLDAGERLASSGGIGNYQRQQYRLALAQAAGTGPVSRNAGGFFLASIVLASLGALISFLPPLWREPAGIRNDGVTTSSSRSRGAIGMLTGALLIGFYIALYFFPEQIVGWIHLADPLSFLMKGQPASRWFFYGMMYTFAVVVMGVRMLVKYRHSRYHVVRTLSVIFFQLGFAFIIPAVLSALNRPEVDLKNIWPLDYSFFYSYRIDDYLASGAFGWFVLIWGIALALIGVPLMAYFFGKRWYCSWVCGCGGLAETLGDPYRHLSDKRLAAWKVERWLVHAVLVFAVVLTAVVLVNGYSARQGDPLLGQATWKLQSWYGFLIGSVFAGVVGTGFYPLMGNRVWCRFGCPLAAILGMVQKFKSRFRITTNGGQCISCGNCSTYCEMGIDVRWYAQRGQNVIRSSCVGCGICAAVCPRGVLRLENGPEAGRYNSSSLLNVVDGRVDG